MTFDLAFDIGGTFTDIALVDTVSGKLDIFKVLTTPEAPERGALTGIREFLAARDVKHGELANVLHATTLVANTLIEQKGALVGLITTAGFRDILEMRTEQRYAIYDLFLRYPEPLSPRYLRRGVTERTDRDGRILRSLNADEVRQVVDDFKAAGVEAIAVVFLHAYRNETNEQQALEIIRSVWNDVPVSLSSVVAPEIREYERASTTVANAYVQPLVARYLHTLRDELAAAGVTGTFHPMLSSGSIAPLSVVIEQPIRLVESGPAAGAIVAAHYGSLAGHADLISFDMGGTTAKICVIDAGRPTLAPNIEVALMHRFKKGSGYPLQFPTVDTIEIGAGGGSIAWVDSLGLLKVGPESAGPNPGPAAYGFGGREPTVTDADLVLGYLNPDYFLGGKLPLDVAAAEAAIHPIAEKFSWSIVQAADGIHRLVNENMASVAKIHVIEKARDPRNYAVVCFGGAGPVHAAGVAQTLGNPEVIVAPSAGVAAAIGLLIAPAAFDFVHSYPTRLEAIDRDEIEAIFCQMEDRGRSFLREVGIAEDIITAERRVDGRFVGQLHEIQIALPGDLTAMDTEEFTARFNETYERLYRHLPSHMEIELLTWRVTVSGQRALVPTARTQPGDPSPEPARKGSRRAYFSDVGEHVRTPVFDRYRLTPGMILPAPAIVEERESTTIIRPGMSGSIDEYFNIHIYLEVD